ncbi:transcriptional regulator [Candidatus Woesearchaeota archaeon]|nr:MAG: transcriptional regulator [Candidatus Woesearchaeota archaeon]
MDNKCTINQVVSFIGKRWTLLVLLELYKHNNTLRYSQLKRCLPGITPKVLSMRLKELEHEGLILKDLDVSSFPIKTTYTLTPSGIAFLKIIDDMKDWALKWKVKNKACSSSDCRDCPLD